MPERSGRGVVARQCMAGLRGRKKTAPVAILTSFCLLHFDTALITMAQSDNWNFTIDL
jgi:hypothetical protein